MRKLLTSPAQLSLSDSENNIFQTALKYIADLSLNLMAVKVTNHPEDFLGWCKELHHICKHDLNMDLLDDKQLAPLKKLQDTLELGISLTQLKMVRIAPWPIFYSIVKEQAELQSLTERVTLMDYVAQLRNQSLEQMIEEDRLVFSGKHTVKHDPSIFQFDVEWFGSTKGAKTFHNLLQSHPQDFDLALANIPLEGAVSKDQYQAFVKDYKAIFSRRTDNEKAPLVVATRLLAMRRPDVFINITNNNLSVLCQGLNIAKFNNQDFDSYYNDMVLSLHCFHWHNQAAPTDEQELQLWNIRAILVDLFLFADDSQAQNSNYIKLRDKPKKTTSGVVKAMKRSKESAEMLVDKALEGDDIPEYLLDMRSTIVNSVKDGKSVEQAIGLMRTIFG
ncbi:hypothetical protein RGQ13_04735 [Thalassotalea psychrophila]|uniref:Orphan protein n=1 Tax=Thalassotalea psychrophila TaxID=3065647 RepID=A0ABY9TWR8_9GAMM|nr:hypothetical protein RGQ13_04735 [Colwelliaceae bacterium SQ149]